MTAPYGAVLVRGLSLPNRVAAVAAVRAVTGDDMAEREGFAPRDGHAPGCARPRTGPPTKCRPASGSITMRTRSMVLVCSGSWRIKGAGLAVDDPTGARAQGGGEESGGSS
ncbi:hypothetical protein [Streptomyces sp. NPDC057494]|uniref:hypothetical protein n=1 Tax=Streptomyces sp. NPDC057494 TaxID=3346148 RepID=UPI0036907E27